MDSVSVVSERFKGNKIEYLLIYLTNVTGQTCFMDD